MSRSMTYLVLAVAGIAAAGPHASAQSVLLCETNLRDACFSNELSMKLTGTVSVVQNGKSISLPRSAEATHVYFERFLDIKEYTVERTARFYNRAEATITDDKDVSKIVLKANHTLLVAHR